MRNLYCLLLLIAWSHVAFAAPLTDWLERRARLDTGGGFMLHRHRKPLYRSDYFSRHKLQSLPKMNLALPGNMDAAIAARSYKNELIVACFLGDPWSLRWIVHFAKMLQALGFDHFIPLAASEEACGMLERSWCGGATCQSAGDGAENGSASASGGESFSSPAHHLFPGCVWVDPTAPGADMGADQSAWMDVSGIDKVHQLWLYRYYLAGEALKRGKNVLMADTDVVVWDDFYKHMKEGQLAKFHFLTMMSEPGPNGGLWYVQNAHPRGPVSQMIAETVRRMLAAAALWKRESPAERAERSSMRTSCSWQDQTVLAETVLAASSNRAFLDWECLQAPINESAWRAVFADRYPLPRPIGNPMRMFKAWRLPWEKFHDIPPLPDPPTHEQVQAAVNHSLIHSPNWESLCRADEPKCPRRLFAFHTDVAHRNRPEFLQLRIPEGWTPLPRPEGNESGNEGARMVELALRGPQFLLDHADSMVLGWNDRKPTWSTVTHIVAFPEAWGPESPDRNNRVQQIMVRNNLLVYLRIFLVLCDPSDKSWIRVEGVIMQIVQAHLTCAGHARGRWHAPMRAPTRMLRVSPRLLADTLALPDDPGADGTGPFRKLLNALIVIAAVTVRVPVIPSAECKLLPWLGRDSKTEYDGMRMSRMGAHDTRVVVYEREVASVVRERRLRGLLSPGASRAAAAAATAAAAAAAAAAGGESGAGLGKGGESAADADDADEDDVWDWAAHAADPTPTTSPTAAATAAAAAAAAAAEAAAEAPVPPVMCAPYFSAGDRCLDPAILSDYNLDQDLMYPSYSADSLDVTAGVSADADGFVGLVLSAARDGDLAKHKDTRVLWLEGDALGIGRVKNETESLLEALTFQEKRYLDEFYEWCRDYNKLPNKTSLLTRQELGWKP